jgi:hypothetical protein
VAQAQGIEATELEDLEHVHEVDAGGAHQHGKPDHHEQPTGVQMAFMVGVGHEPQCEGEAGEHQGPCV